MRLPLSLALAGLLALVPAAVRAETGVPCDACTSGSDAIIPKEVPANTPGIIIRGSVEVTSVSLVAPDGTTIPTTLSGDSYERIVKLDSALKEGVSYTLKWSDTCDAMRTETFKTTAPVPLPTTAGVASVGAQATDLHYGRCDASGRPFLQVRRAVTLMPSPELVAFLPLARVDTLVDGVISGYSGAFLACPTSAQSQSVVIRVSIPGGPTVSTPPVMVSLACPDAPPTPCEADVVPPKDPAPNSDLNEELPSESHGGGCAVTTGTSDGAVMLLLLGALITRGRAAKRTIRPR